MEQLQQQTPEFIRRYDLNTLEQRELTGKLLAEADFPPTKRYVCMVVPGDSEYSNLGRTLECDVFDRYFQNDNKTMDNEYGTYEDDSLFCLILDRSKQKPAGVLRVLKYSQENSLKSLKDVDEIHDISQEDFVQRHNVADLNKCWDIATLAVDRHHIGKMSGEFLKVMLFRTFFKLGRQQDMEHIVAVIDKHARRGALELGIPLVSLAGVEKPFEYLGSKVSYAVYGDFTQFEERVVARWQEKFRASRFTLENLRRESLKGLLIGRAVAHFAGKLATGRGLDSHIRLLSQQPFSE